MSDTIILTLFFGAVIALIVRSYLKQDDKAKQTKGKLYGNDYKTVPSEPDAP